MTFSEIMTSIQMLTVTRTFAVALVLPSLTALCLPVSARPPLGIDDAESVGSGAHTVQPALPHSAPAAATVTPDLSMSGDRTDEFRQQPSEPLSECPPTEPHRVGADLCMSQEAVDRINDGWQASVDPATGRVTWTPPPSYDPVTGQWGNFSAATQACDPNIEIKLKEAALAGSQLTRAMSDRQMSYPEVDPLAAVNNPQRDGYGGVCTIDLFALDLRRLLGGTYNQIRNLIDTISHLSMDSLFGAACQVVNTVFGDLQNQLLQEVQNSSPLTAFQQFVNALHVGYIAPLQSLTSYGLTPQSTTATLPGVVTTQPLQVAYVPGKGYLYLADFGSGNRIILHISPTPLIPEDAVRPVPP